VVDPETLADDDLTLGTHLSVTFQTCAVAHQTPRTVEPYAND
jgi:hypothetical protein